MRKCLPEFLSHSSKLTEPGGGQGSPRFVDARWTEAVGALAPLLKTVVFSHHDAQACHLHPPGHSQCPGRPSEGQWTVADLTATLCVFCPKEESRRGQPEGRTEAQFVPDLDGCHFLGHLLGTQVASGAPHPPEAPGQRHEHQHSAHGKPSGAAPGEQSRSRQGLQK